MVLAILVAVLGLHEQHTVDGFVSVESHSSGILQNGHTFHFFHGDTVDRAFHTIHENQNVSLASRLDTTDVKRCATTFLTLEASVLVGIQARELAIECICQADG